MTAARLETSAFLVVARLAVVTAVIGTASAGCVPVSQSAGGGTLGAKRDPLDAYQKTSTTAHPAPTDPPVLQPWKAGQWAAYQRTRGTSIDVVVVRVIAEDACGAWVDVEEDDGEHRRISRVCVVRKQAPDGTVTIERLRALAKRVDGSIDVRTDLNMDADLTTGDGAKLRALLSAGWSGRRGVTRKDVTTPAGTFVALEESSGTGQTRWSHPSVPITGMVREVDATGEELLLLEHGLATTTSAVFDDSRQLQANARSRVLEAAPRKLWLGFLFGSEGFGTIDEAKLTASFGGMVGYRFHRSLALVADSASVPAVEYTSNPDLVERFSIATLALRWHPWKRPVPLGRGLGFDAPSVYWQFGVGYAQLDRGEPGMTSSTVGRGIVGGLRLGVTINQYSPHWRLGLELHEHTAWLNGDEGVRIIAGLRANVELLLR